MRELRTKFGQVTLYNDVLSQENEDLRQAINSAGQGRRRNYDLEADNESARPIKRRRKNVEVTHSSNEESEDEELDERTRVRLKLSFKFTFFQFNLILILTDFY